ncbi:MAG: enoyl-CoA hydratase/isomerase family protein [Oligoflexia bacterium]|nr:enoyl-CoA hydratase/isomerase family protein [Oligoflexia bacterium]
MEIANLNLSRLTFEVKEQIAYLGFGKYSEKSMTVIDRETLIELDKLLKLFYEEKSYKNLDGLIFFSHKPGCFLAGADISMISTLKSVEEAFDGAQKGQELYNRIEDLTIPTVACIDGVCLGGGLELALACRHILASDSPKTSLGLPEVQLGILPGFGGTYRLPQRVTLPNALDLILSGRQLKGYKAYKMGLADEIYPSEYLLPMAVKILRKPKFFNKKSGLKDSISNFLQDNFLVRKVIFQKAREKVLKKTRGLYDAPLKILDLMESGPGHGRATYLHNEAQAFAELALSQQSAGLRNIFFLMDAAKKAPFKTDSPSPRTLKRGAVVGSGVMGGGLAYLMSESNMRPILKDLNYESLEIGVRQAALNYASSVKKKRITRDEWEKKQRSIIPSTTYHGFSRVDLVIEAIFEDMEIKKRLFQEIESKVAPSCIITTNTSSLSVEEMASALQDPSRFAGLHFFNPVAKMPLVEIIAHPKCAPETIDTLYRWVLATKKTPLIVKDSPGFLVNRILGAFIKEAIYLLEEGVRLQDIDNACLNFGLAMGPFRLLDEVGIDIALKVGKIFNEKLGERFNPAPLSKKLEELKILGKKGGKGFYLYSKSKGSGDSGDSGDDSERSSGSGGDRPLEINPELKTMLPEKNILMDEESIQKRLILPMINEAAYLLEEGVVKSAGDVDLGMIFGTGFAPFRGGLLRYADFSGVSRIQAEMEKFASSISALRYAPAPLLKKLVAEKRNFYDYQP